ncbi:uncharacterized protein LOC111679077 [Lucilia cuprina]|uniref:uncharacterized protein LOC111679077 n=1 Tax=Lucilia cuprina TaxID=7375 RepID=UPI001F059D5F|nr:uncharacterized protein LOC111679077 [Lucilia cuprina]
MVAPSKVFTSPLKCYHCSQSILHPGVGCIRNFLDNLLHHGLSGLKYFSPLLITPLVMKYKTMNRELFVNTLKYYLQTVCSASMATSSVFLMICCLRNYLGNFRTYTTLFLPTVLGLQFCWFFPSRVMKLFTTATSQTILEGLLRQNENKFTHLILHSQMMQTILFMLNSAIILHYKRKNIYKDYWFIQPYEKLEAAKNDANKDVMINGKAESVELVYNVKCQTKCVHNNTTCVKFLLDGIKSYLVYGIPLDLLAMLIRGKIPQGTQGFTQKVIEKFKTFRPNMTGFFISYVGIYRLSACLLRKYYGHLTPDLQHLLSAFLGGFSYVCSQRVNLLYFSLVLSMQQLWQQFCTSIKSDKKTGKQTNLVLWILKSAPMSQIIFCINCGYLVHNYILNYHLVNSLAKGFLDALTCNRIKNIRDTLIKNDLPTLINIAESNSIRKFL